ncbi:MAG TPA: terminase small subunit [Gemmataceae bacterium]|nr:terminase small subunit [Gemmataceae bacterium]
MPAARPLTPKQQRFVEQYLVDLNASAAYKRAGYRCRSDAVARVEGSRLLANPNIAAAIAAAQAQRSERTQLDQDYVLDNLREVLERCMQRAPVMVREGGRMVQAIDEEGRHVWTFNSKGALGSLTLLGRHLGMFTEKHQHEHTGQNGGPIEATVSHDIAGDLAPYADAIRAFALGSGQALPPDGTPEPVPAPQAAPQAGPFPSPRRP